LKAGEGMGGSERNEAREKTNQVGAVEIDATLLLDSTAANNEIAGLLVGVVEARAAPDEFEQRAPHRVEFGRVDERIHADVEESSSVVSAGFLV